MERRNFQGANRKHNSDLSVCHTAHTPPHTFGHAVEKKKKKTRTKKQKSLSSRESGTVICPWSNGRIHHLLQPAELHHSPQQAKPPWQEQRERENTEREGERWKRGGRSAERTSWFKLRHVDMCALCAQFSVCVSICSRQRGLTKSALLVWHTGWVSVPEKSLKSCFFFNAGALNKVLCCENRSNAPNWTFQRV